MAVSFRLLCEQAGALIDDTPMFCEGENGTDVFEDDGYLHVRRRGTRAVFNVSKGQTLNGEEQNKRTVIVMEALGMKSKIDERVLVDEEPDEEENEGFCPACGREL
jgi:hypothetical protein